MGAVLPPSVHTEPIEVHLSARAVLGQAQDERQRSGPFSREGEGAGAL